MDISNERNSRFFPSTIIGKITYNVLSMLNVSGMRINEDYKSCNMKLLMEMSKSFCEFIYNESKKNKFTNVGINEWNIIMQNIKTNYMYPLFAPTVETLNIGCMLSYKASHDSKSSDDKVKTIFINTALSQLYDSLCVDFFHDETISIHRDLFIFMSYIILTTLTKIIYDNILFLVNSKKKTLTLEIFKLTLLSKFYSYNRMNVYEVFIEHFKVADEPES
jgi:hypothetical protein